MLTLPMLRNGAFLLLEGVDDQAFWNLHVDSSRCATVESNGVTNLIAALQTLPVALTDRVVAVADSDFRQFTKIDLFATVAPSVLFYDHGFLETFLLDSAAFNKVLRKFGSLAKIAAFEVASGKSVLDYVRELGTVFGQVRVASVLNGWFLPMKDFSPYKYVSQATWTIDSLSLHEAIADAVNLKKLPGVANIGQVDVTAACGAIVSNSPFSLVHGHDALKLLDIGFMQVVGDRGPGANRIFEHLCTGFEAACLATKIAVGDLEQWSQQRGYKLM